MSEHIRTRPEPHVIFERLMEVARISALEEMASGIAHELNQPLGAIATFAQAGERMLDRPEPLVRRALDVFRQINAEALSAGDEIRRVRRLFDHGTSTRIPCTMQDVIEELRPALEILALKVEGELRVEAIPSLAPLLLDRLRIQHVLCALVQNAFDAGATTTKHPTVTLQVTGDRYIVQTNIVDVGSGVPSDVRPQLFRPFFTTKQMGTGLGLASSRAIIEAHEGTIGFDPVPQGGCRFWFRLPVSG